MLVVVVHLITCLRSGCARRASHHLPFPVRARTAVTGLGAVSFRFMAPVTSIPPRHSQHAGSTAITGLGAVSFHFAAPVWYMASPPLAPSVVRVNVVGVQQAQDEDVF